MTLAKYLFWACLLLTVYAYFVYPVLLFLVYSVAQAKRDWEYLISRRNRRTLPVAPDRLPAVSLLMSVFNEEPHLEEKFANLRRLDYPRDRLEVVFVSDGSTDATNQILSALADTNIRTVFLPERKGKANALNVAVAAARHDILVLSDAATLLTPDVVKNMVRHFADPQVGLVCGALQFVRTPESQHTEGAYWAYESMLRLMEARLGATLTASGAIYAMRRECYLPLGPGIVIEDFLIPMNARKLGYQVLYDPEAVAVDFAAPSVAGEFARRVRLAVGSYRAFGELLRVPLRGFTMLGFISHKLLRWIVPFLLIGMGASNLFLTHEPFYRFLLAGQLLFYLWAGLGFVLRSRMQPARFALVGYFLLAMNLAFLVGFFRFLAGSQEVKWQWVN
jgi:cellulose synthase/poly-beta-1,6-N-acetylglucosamine synthase-like glycosyltransferase